MRRPHASSWTRPSSQNWSRRSRRPFKTRTASTPTTADIRVPRLDEYCLGQLLQMFMLATVVERRLVGINPYGQPGVEAYKKNMAEIIYGG